MNITYYGHSCFSVEVNGTHLLFDPFVSGNQLASHVDPDAIPADYIFVSHGHLDHTLDVVRIANRTGATVLGGWELYKFFMEQGVKNAHPINPGGKVTFGFGTVKAVSAVNSSSFQDGRYAGVASGFVVKTPQGNFYYSGDTALTLDMTLIPKWANLNFAVLHIGDGLTMGIDEAVEAAKLVEVNQVLGVHYNTFDFIKIDSDRARQVFATNDLTLHLPRIGTTIDL